ncbi:hypothetical protein DMUE_5441 [Dictyocoela muelleri]|nr:hypothetical protein DMUE_5441 [Dictyocoela muelleri]
MRKVFRIKEEKKGRNSSIKMKSEDDHFEYALFVYKSRPSGFKMRHRINVLSSFDDQDILNWSNIFNEVAMINKKSEDVRLEVLIQIVDPDLDPKFPHKLIWVKNFPTNKNMLNYFFIYNFLKC